MGRLKAISRVVPITTWLPNAEQWGRPTSNVRPSYSHPTTGSSSVAPSHIPRSLCEKVGRASGAGGLSTSQE